MGKGKTGHLPEKIEIIACSAFVLGGDIIVPKKKVSVDRSLAESLIARGRAELSTENDEAENGSLGKMTVAELKDIAADIPGSANMNKRALIEAIEEAQGA